jgi:hypothetical protein
MSNTIFKYCPHFMEQELTTKFNVAKSDFELPIVQRRLLSSRAQRMWKFNYKTRLFDNITELKKLQDEILAFFEARYGSFDNFYLPSFELETRAVSVTASTITLNMDATLLGFSATTGAYGNLIYIANRLYTIFGTTGYYESILKITSITGTGNVTLNVTAVSPFTYTYTNFNSGGNRPYIMKVCKANFQNDELKRAFDNPYAWASDIEFVEDLSDAYTLVLP